MFPYEIKPVDKDVNQELMKSFRGERNGFCQVGPKKWMLPLAYSDHAEKYYDFKLRKDDLWVVTYPRSGTTLTQELTWLLNNNLNYEKAKELHLIDRFPYFEFNIVHSKQLTDEVIELNNGKQEVIDEMERRHLPGYVLGEKMASPRHFKSHLPLSLLPPNLLSTCKVIYIARNPKDVAVSYYHQNKLFSVHDYVGDFPKYWNYFEKDLLLYSPYWEHLREAWERRSDPNLLFLFYENLILDMPGSIKKVATFLNKTITEEQVDKLVKHLQFDNFRVNVPLLRCEKIHGLVNDTAQDFVRRGKIGGNEEYTEDIVGNVDSWIRKNLSLTDLRFPSMG